MQQKAYIEFVDALRIGENVSRNKNIEWYLKMYE